MRKLFSDKKGNSVLDSITVMIVLVIFILVVVISYMVFDSLYEPVKASVNSSSTASEILTKNHDKYPSVFDDLILFVFVGLWIGALIASFMIDTHPIFFAVMIILLLFVIIASVYISNTYNTIISSSDGLTSSAASFPKTSWIMNHLLEMVIAMAMSIGLVLYAKLR